MSQSLEIFIVDDDIDVAEGLADALELHGHKITLAHSGKEAVEFFSQRDFDITFMDVMMPGMNGVESFLEIRKIKPQAKVVMLTGYSVEQLLQQAVENGAVAVLHKPVAMEAVQQALEEVRHNKGMVLVADDDPDFSDSVTEILKLQGYRTCIARDGEAAVEMVAAGGIDVLILDIQMPLIDGLAVYLELQKRNRVVPTIVVTGYPEEESNTLETFRNMSVTGILVKPFDPRDLLQTLQNIKEAA